MKYFILIINQYVKIFRYRLLEFEFKIFKNEIANSICNKNVYMLKSCLLFSKVKYNNIQITDTERD